jgi:pimeloyl-ACP methyl ester carboxylesterase
MNMTPYHPFRSAAAKTEYLTRYDEMAQAWPVTSECQMVDTAYGQTFVRISGPVDAPPLVLLPGAGTNSLQWLFNIEALSEHYRTYAVDSLIHMGDVGRSIFTRPITCGDDVVKCLNDLFDGLGLEDNINLLGGSYGGWSASQFALHASDRLNKVVLIAPAGMVLPFRGAYMMRSMFINIVPRRKTFLRFFKWSFKDLANKDVQFLESMADDFMASSKCFAPINPKQIPRLTSLTDEELQRIQAPILFLVGENEVLYSAQKAVQRLKTVAPHIQTEMIPNAGHDLLLVQTELVNRKIVDFLRGR